MEEPFVLSGVPEFKPEYGEANEDDLQFRVNKPPSLWTEENSRTLEAALDLAGITDPAERLRMVMSVDLLGIVILTPLVRTAEGWRQQIRGFFYNIKGGSGK